MNIILMHFLSIAHYFNYTYTYIYDRKFWSKRYLNLNSLRKITIFGNEAGIIIIF